MVAGVAAANFTGASTTGFSETLNRLNSSNSKDVIGACAVITLTANAPTVTPELVAVIPRLVELIKSDDVSTKKNSCTALASALNANPECSKLAIENAVAEPLVTALSSSDNALVINALNACGSLCETGPEGANCIVAANGVEAYLEILNQNSSTDVLETVLDSICKLAVEPSQRHTLIVKGTIPHLARLLEVPEREVQVRVLLSLGMLLGADPHALVQLAEVEGAIKSVLKLMKQTDDEDCRQVACSLFVALGGCPATKDKLAAILKQPDP